jgi:hypothetical protein
MVKKLPPSGTRLNLKTYFATMPETDQPFHKPHYWANTVRLVLQT